MTVNFRRFSPAYALILMLVLVTTAGMAAGTRTPVSTGLPNFHQVGPGIYRGAAPTTQGLHTLQSMGIHTIIDLRISPKLVKQEKARAEAMGFTWINLPMGSEPPTQKQVDTLLAVLARAPQETVYVHCQHGADRTGCMIGIYRVQVLHWAFPQAWKEMRRYGFNPRWTKLTAAVRSRVKR